MADLEPLLDWSDIQGNVLGGFNKDHQTLLGYAFDGDVLKAKSFVASIAREITPLRDVVPFKHEMKRRTSLGDGSEKAMRAIWTAIAFSFDGLRLLAPDADLFVDSEFRDGLAKSSGRLGDPIGNSAGWLVGAPGNVPDLFIIIAADYDNDRAQAVANLSLRATAEGLRQIYSETGHNLSHYSTDAMAFPSGHEHFGFKDGISQPGVRGTLPDGEFLTPRLALAEPLDGTDYAAPGQPLVCAGEFILGEATQIDVFPRQPGPPVALAPAVGAAAPAWAKNGSFLVFRRLRQNVRAFQQFCQQIEVAAPTLTSGRGAAMLVGRWPSGAPLVRTPDQDSSDQTKPELINTFAYGDDNSTFGLPNDDIGNRCPIVAHVRKVNPRDEDTDQGAASATLTHRILRRGIPFGAPLTANSTGQADAADRGLLFLSYQASIARQFEFLASRWANSAQNPRNPSVHAEGMGQDLLIGQVGGDRTRFAYLPTAIGDCKIDSTNFDPKDWVVATGGGYFFAPSISAINEVLSR